MSSNKDYFEKIGVFVKPSSFEDMCANNCSRRTTDCTNPSKNNNKSDLVSNNSNCKTRKRAEKAFKLAHEIRKFEIELFWKRGTYYWAFILASFTAYFAVINKVIGKHDKLSFSTLISLPTLTQVVLCVISFLCFFFCLSWVLINKGSKFWQKNWEAHIDMLEDEFSGNLYKTFLNTSTDDFSSCPLSKKSYDYSVTKITTIGSIVLMIVSFAFLLFHILLFFGSALYINFENKAYDVLSIKLILISVIFLIIFVPMVLFFLDKCKGNTDNDDKNKSDKWYQRRNKNEQSKR